MRKNTGFITVTVTGSNITTGAASASAALPLASSGEVPRYIRFAVTANARIRMGVGAGTTALATDMLVTPGDAVVLDVPRGYTHWAAIQDSAAGTACATPLEDC
jgi:hypothetical protein